MNFSLFILPVLFLQFYSVAAKHHVSNNLRKRLDAEEENAVCCMNHLDCCKESQQQSPTFEVKSIITECPNVKCTNFSSEKIVVQHNKTVEKLTECKQKLLLTIKMTNEGIPSDKSQYVIIDHIVDASNLKKIRILNPYAVRIRQAPMMQEYDLQYEKTVNGEAKEVVYNKHKRNYQGCDTGYENPTCGLVEHDGKVVPYSTGFCCSCDAEKNRMLEMQGDQVQWPQDGIPEYHKKYPVEHDYQHYKHYGFSGGDGRMVYGWAQKDADKRENFEQFTELRDGQIRQRRGGQSCEDIDVQNLPESFHESAHCLTFSNLWYSVYKISKPKINHKLKIQIFQKYEDCHGDTHWMDLTQQKVIEMGTNQRSYVDKDFIARYSSEDIEPNDGALDYKKFKLLVAERRIVDPDQFMVLPNHIIAPDGKTCDTAGVGYEAFAKQKERCAQPQGSCLENQPNQLFDKDIQAEKNNQQGDYFLKNFGTLAQDPVTYNSTGHIESLKMVYTKRHISNLFFELNADLVTLLKPNAFATITEIYTDATNPAKSRVIVKVTNSGLLFGVFYVRLSNCPLDVPASFNNIASKSVLITAQHQHIYNLYIEYPLPVKEFYCSIHVHNVNQELIAVRPVRFRTYDRCICIWHCECACYVADGGLRCTPLSLDVYHAAGFQGGFATPVELIESSYLDEMLAMFFDMFLFLILTLLAMGLVKALLGLCFRDIGLWGLDVILGTQKSCVICENEECEYKKDDGVSVAGQFCLNVLFFFLYPLALFNVCIKKLCFSKYTLEGEPSYQEEWIDYECEGSCKNKSSKTKSSLGSGQFSLKYTTSEDKSTGESRLNEEEEEDDFKSK